MKIYSIYDKEFNMYGRIVNGMEESVNEILSVLTNTPVPEGTHYVHEDPALQQLPAMTEFSEHLYGGMPIQLGWCNGHNTKLNCLEYHRSSEFNLGAEDFILLLAKQYDIENGKLDTSKVKAFRVPKGVLIECYATTLHYCPCHTDLEKGFKTLVVLPQRTNTQKPQISEKTEEDKLLFACDKWLLAHKDSPEATNGAYVGLIGENFDISNLL